MTDDSFRIRLGRIYSPSGYEKFISLAKGVRHGAVKAARGRRGTNRRRNTNFPHQYFQRRVIVKFSIVRMDAQGRSRQALHLKYIGRDTQAKERDISREDHGRLFDREGRDADTDAFRKRGVDDPHQFRIIVSPEDSCQLSDLEGFTRDLMGQMESDLGMGLDWVGACHYDTARPHSHIVVRGLKENGQKLIIPRHYIAYGMREQAARLVALELGPINIREAGQRLARQVTQERLTSLDRGLLQSAQDNVLDVGKGADKRETWTRRLDIARLKFLSRMGLAKKMSPTRWKLDPSMEKTLRDLGERGDVLKAYHKALRNNGIEQQKLEDFVYDFSDPATGKIEGQVISAGVLDDINDRAFLVIKPALGDPVYVPVGGSANIEGLKKGIRVELSANTAQAKPSDLTIAKIARMNNGIYDVKVHALRDPGASPKFLRAHVRRLQALGKLGVSNQAGKGTWRIPDDYIARVTEIERRGLRQLPVNISILPPDRTIAGSGVPGLDL